MRIRTTSLAACQVAWDNMEPPVPIYPEDYEGYVDAAEAAEAAAEAKAEDASRQQWGANSVARLPYDV